MSYWHDFTHPVITNAGDNQEFTEVAEGELGIPTNAQDVADKFDSPKRQRPKSAVTVTPSPSKRAKSMPRLHRRRYGGKRTRRRQPYMHGASYRAGSYNPVHFRRRRRSRYSRRKLRWGTKVRKQALGLFEGKRNVVNSQDVNARDQNTILNLGLFNNFVTDEFADDHGDIKSAQFNGRKIHVRGIKFNLWCFNKTVTHPCIVRVICGWRKIYADIGTAGFPLNNFAIFRNTDTKQHARLLTETADWQRNVTWRTTKAPIDKQAFHLVKDMTFQLGPSDKEDEQNHGNAFKQISFWWELNNRILNTRADILSTDDANTRGKKLSFYPVVIIYHNNAEVGTSVSTLVDYKYDYAVYWKDPLG